MIKNNKFLVLVFLFAVAMQLFLFKQALSTPNCIDAAPPICGGNCPNGGSCVPDLDSKKCECLPVAHLPPAPCDKATAPACKGECLEAGKECFPPDPRNPNLGCECKTPCGDTTAPSCNGGCWKGSCISLIPSECECKILCTTTRAPSCGGFCKDDKVCVSNNVNQCECVIPTPTPTPTPTPPECRDIPDDNYTFDNDYCSAGKCAPGRFCTNLLGGLGCGCAQPCGEVEIPKEARIKFDPETVDLGICLSGYCPPGDNSEKTYKTKTFCRRIRDKNTVLIGCGCQPKATSKAKQEEEE